MSISTGTVASPGIPRSAAQVSKPSSPGICASSTTISGVLRASSASASSPLVASVTSKPRWRKAVEVSSRLTSSSSTSNTRGSTGGGKSVGEVMGR